MVTKVEIQAEMYEEALIAITEFCKRTQRFPPELLLADGIVDTVDTIAQNALRNAKRARA